MKESQVGPPLRKYPPYLLTQEGAQSTFTEVRAYDSITLVQELESFSQQQWYGK